MPLELAVSLPAVGAVAVLFIYLRSAAQTRALALGPLRAPKLAYAVDAALRGQPLLLTVCWTCGVRAVVRWLDLTVSRVGDRLEIIESQDRLSEWWNHHVSYTRELARYNAYEPRHSYERWRDPETFEDRIAGAGWRLHWAQYPTQFWPCLATRGDAYDTVDVTTSLESYAR